MSGRLRLLLLLLSGTIVAVALVSALLLLGGPEIGRHLAERVVTRHTGRPFVIAGPVRIDWGRRLVISAKDLRLANAEWAVGTYMLKVKALELVVDLRSLIDRPVMLEIAVDQSSLALETREAGSNWQFPATGEPPTDDNPAPALILQRIQVRDSNIGYRAPNLERPLRIGIAEFDQQVLDSGLLQASLDGRVNERSLELQARFGPLDQLAEGTDIDIQANARIDRGSIRFAGHIDDLARPRQPRAELQVEGPNIGDLTELLGLGRLDDGPFELSAELSPEDESSRFSIAGQFGRLRTDAKGRIRDLQHLDGIDVEAEVLGPNLGRLLRVFGLEGPEEPFRLSGDFTRDGRDLRIDEARFEVADAEFDLSGNLSEFPSLDDARLDLEISGSEIAKLRELLGLPGIASGPFRFDARAFVDEQGNERINATGETNLGQLNAEATLGDPQTFIGTRLNIELQGDSLKRVGDAAAIDNLPAIAFDLSSNVEFSEPGQLDVRKLDLRVGRDRLRAEGRVGLDDAIAGSDLQLRANGPSLADTLAIAGLKRGIPAEPFELKTRLKIDAPALRFEDLDGRIRNVQVSGSGSIPDLRSMTGSDWRLRLRGPDPHTVALLPVVRRYLPSAAFDVSGLIRLSESGYRFTDVNAKLADAEAQIDALLSEAADLRGSFVRFEAVGANLARVTPETPHFDPLPEAFELEGRVERVDQGLTLNDIRLRHAGTTGRIDAELGLPLNGGGGRFAFDLSGPDSSVLKNLSRLFPDPRPFDIKARGEWRSDRWQVDDFDVSLGRSDLTGQLQFKPGEPPELEIDLRSNELHALRGFTRQSADENQPPGVTDKRVIPDRSLPLDQLRRLNLRADLAVESLHLPNTIWRNLRLAGEMRDGALTIDQADVEGVEGRISGSLAVTPRDRAADVRLTLRLEDLNTGLLTNVDKELRAMPTTSADIRLTGHGATLRELAASLDGHGWIRSSDGRVPNNRLGRLLAADFLNELFTTLNPLAKQEPYTEVVCVALPFSVTQGKLASQPSFVAQTSAINILSQGTIDLGSERLDLNFRTQARKGLGISASQVVNPFLKVGGTLGQPRLTLDPTGSLVTGGATVATGGLWLLVKGAFDSLFRARDPCGRTMAEQEKLLAEASG